MAKHIFCPHQALFHYLDFTYEIVLWDQIFLIGYSLLMTVLDRQGS